MGFSLKKLVEGAVAQVNPFDNGKTFATVQRNQPAPPAQIPQQGMAPQAQAQIQNARYGVLANNPKRQRAFIGSVSQPQLKAFNPILEAPKVIAKEAVPTVGAGIGRSIVGAAEGISGAADLLTPGTGTNRVTKALVNQGRNIDQYIERNNFDKTGYKIAQGTTDIASFLAPGAIAKGASLAAKTGGVTGKVGKALSSTAPLIDKPVLKYASSPANLLNTGVGTVRSQGYIASREQDVNPGTVATGLGANLLLGTGANVVGSKVVEPLVNSNIGKNIKDGFNVAVSKPQAPEELLNKQSKLLTARAAMEVKNKPTGSIDSQISNVGQEIKQATTRPILRPFTNEIGAVGKNVDPLESLKQEATPNILEQRKQAERAYKEYQKLVQKYQGKPKAAEKLSASEKASIDKQANEYKDTFTKYYKENGGFETGTGYLKLTDDKGVDLYNQSQPPKSPLETGTSSNWRESVDTKKFGDDPDTNANLLKDKQDTLRAITQVSKSDSELADVLLRAEQLHKDGYLGDNANLAWDIMQNPASSKATKARATKLYKEITAPAKSQPPLTVEKTPPDFLKTSPEYIAAESKPRPDGSKVVVKASRNPETGNIQTRQELVDKNTDLPSAYQQPEVTDRLAQMGQKQRSEPPSLEPIPNAKKELNDSTNTFLGGYQADKTKNMGITRTLPELKENDSIKLMDAIESGGDFNGLPPQVRTILDAKHQELTDAGIDIGYVKDYFPHSWKNEDEVRRAYQSLNQRASIQNERSLPTISEGMSLGFKPRYTDYREAVNAYLNTADKLLQNRKYFDDLQTRGLINESYQPPKGMQVIDAPGIPKPRPYIDPDTGAQIQGNFYATPEIAKKLNRLFGDRSPNGAFEKGLDLTAYASRFLQDIGLAGGVPGTPLNAFTFAQVTKELMSGSVKNPIVATFKSFTKEGYRKYSDKNNDVIQAMQRQGIKIRDDYNYKNLGDEITSMVEQEGGKKRAIARGWDKVFSDPTFKRFMPALQIEMFKKVQKGALKKGMPLEQADKVAADAVGNFYGLNRLAKESFRGKAGTDAATTVLFAPKYRESMVNFLIVNNAKALNPAKWGAREYRANQKFMVGAALLLAGENYANEYLNGVPMYQNPDGKKDKLIIPADKIPGKPTNGKDIAIPFLPSIATVPRYAGSALYNTLTGNQEQAVKDASGFLSFGLRPLIDTFATNENYFGDKIVEEGTSPVDAAKQRAGYLLTQYQHPYIREGVRTAQGKNRSLFETVSKASESPLRFYDPKYYKYGDTFVPKGPEGEKYNFKEQRERAGIKREIENIPSQTGLSKRQKADYDSLGAVEFNEDGTLKEDNNPFYKSQRYTKLQDDGVFEAMKRKAELNAKLNGKPIDPIYGLEGAAKRLVLWKKTLPPGTSDPSVKKIYEQDWYADFQKQEDQYYDAKKSWNTKMGYKNPVEDNTYPIASDTVKKAQDYYFTLPKGTGARSAWIRANPEAWNQMISFWNAKDQWTNGERSKLGLGPLDEKTDSTGSYAYNRRGGRKGGRRGRGGSKSNLSTRLYAFNSDPVPMNKSLRQLVANAKVKGAKSKKIKTKIA